MRNDTAPELEIGRRHCQTFPQGCCGCCINTRWGKDRIHAFLEANTAAAERLLPAAARPRFADLVRLHWMRGGWVDHLLALWLVMPTFGLSAWVWRRFLGSCRFAGLIDRESGRVGCLIHPLRVGGSDCRRHAFPLIPSLGCHRDLRCAMLDAADTDWSCDSFEASLRGRRSMRARQRDAGVRTGGRGRHSPGMRAATLAARLGRLRQCEHGGVLLEYIILSILIVLPLMAAGMFVFNPSGLALSVPTFDAATGEPTGTAVTTFGFLGDAFVGWYQRITCGVSLPVP